MAKRFIDTDKWKAPWFEDLSGIAKAFHYFYYAQCDHAGVWQGSFKQFRYFTGFDYTAEQMLQDFPGRIIPLSNGAYFMPDFIVDQYTRLSPENNAHIGVMKSLVLNEVDHPVARYSETMPRPVGRVSDKRRREILASDFFTCTYCGKHGDDITLSVDHIHPRLEGGDNSPENLTTSCLDCNSRKTSKTVFSFIDQYSLHDSISTRLKEKLLINNFVKPLINSLSGANKKLLGAQDKDTVKDKDQDKDQEKEELERVTSPLPSTEPPPQKTISESDVIALYNETCAGHGEIKRFDFFFLPPEARTNFINRSGEPGYRTKDQWREFFKKVLESDFLLGKKTGHVASLPWLLKPDKFVEVATGVHKNRQVAKETASEANAKADALFENIVRAGRYQFKRADYTETDMKALEGIGGLAVIFDCTDFTKKTVIANLRTEYKKALEAM